MAGGQRQARESEALERGPAVGRTYGRNASQRLQLEDPDPAANEGLGSPEPSPGNVSQPSDLIESASMRAQVEDVVAEDAATVMHAANEQPSDVEEEAAMQSTFEQADDTSSIGDEVLDAQDAAASASALHTSEQQQQQQQRRQQTSTSPQNQLPQAPAASSSTPSAPSVNLIQQFYRKKQVQAAPEAPAEAPGSDKPSPQHATEESHASAAAVTTVHAKEENAARKAAGGISASARRQEGNRGAGGRKEDDPEAGGYRRGRTEGSTGRVEGGANSGQGGEAASATAHVQEGPVHAPEPRARDFSSKPKPVQLRRQGPKPAAASSPEVSAHAGDTAHPAPEQAAGPAHEDVHDVTRQGDRPPSTAAGRGASQQPMAGRLEGEPGQQQQQQQQQSRRRGSGERLSHDPSQAPPESTSHRQQPSTPAPAPSTPARRTTSTPSTPTPATPGSAARPTKSRVQGRRSDGFDEDDPVQVLEESYRVLAEVELLICESLQLPVGSSLDSQDLQLLSQVPGPLLDALEGTVQVVIDARNQLSGGSEWETGSQSSRSTASRPCTGSQRGWPSASNSPRPSRASDRASASSDHRPSQTRSSRSSVATNGTYPKKRDFLREPPPAEWVEAQQQRQAAAQQRRVQQVQQDLRLIHQIKSRGLKARQHHEQALQESEASLANLKVQASQTKAHSKWLQYQEALAGGGR